MRRRVPSSVTWALVLSAAVGLGAGGDPASNGVDAKPAGAIVAASRQAADAATSVHAAGSIAAKGAPTRFDLTLVNGKGARGTLSVNRASFRLIRIGSTIYVKASPSFLQRFGGAAARRLRGKWLKGRATTGSFAAIGPFTDLVTFVDGTLASAPSTQLTKGATTTVAGQSVVQVMDGSGGTLSVATLGEPYPVQIAARGRSGGTISFDRWNAPVRLTAPHQSIDINHL